MFFKVQQLVLFIITINNGRIIFYKLHTMIHVVCMYLYSSVYRLNEEMIETLFMVNASNSTPKDNFRRHILPTPIQENRVLDPKKSQNIAILLRALNVTIDEVCEALLEGNQCFFFL